MDPAKVELEAAINATDVHAPKCPVYQNVDALPHTDPAEIKKNLVAQLTPFRTLDTNGKEHGCRWCHRLYGMWSGRSIARSC